MRYSIKDLLLMTALLAIYLTGLRFVLASIGLEGAKGILIGSLAFSVVFLLVFFVLSIVMKRSTKRLHQPFFAKVTPPFPWISSFVMAAICLLGALVAQLHSVLIGMFIGFSMVFWLHFLLNILSPSAHFSTGGVLFQNWFIKWKDIYPVRQADGLLTHIRVSNPYLGHKLAVPEELREQVDALIPKRMDS